LEAVGHQIRYPLLHIVTRNKPIEQAAAALAC
jgi:hypothetical protein